MATQNILAEIKKPFTKLIVYGESRGGHVLDEQDLVAAGVDPELARKGAGLPDCDATVVLRWSRRNPLGLERLKEIADPPTSREITRRVEKLEKSEETLTRYSEFFEAMAGRSPSKKEMKSLLWNTATADLMSERHQLSGLPSHVDQCVRKEIARQKHAASGIDEKEIRGLNLGPGTDIYVYGENAEGENMLSQRTIPLELADSGTWEYMRQGETQPRVYGFWNLRPPKRFGRSPDNAQYGVCRTGLRADGEYTFFVYYRLPTETRRGVIVVKPMNDMKRLLKVKYEAIAAMYEDLQKVR